MARTKPTRRIFLNWTPSAVTENSVKAQGTKGIYMVFPNTYPMRPRADWIAHLYAKGEALGKVLFTTTANSLNEAMALCEHHQGRIA